MVAEAKLTGIDDVFKALADWRVDVARSSLVAVGDAMSIFHAQVTKKNLGKSGINSAPMRRAVKSEAKAEGSGRGAGGQFAKRAITGRVWFRDGKWLTVALAHEHGAKIRAKRVKHLAIPSKYTKSKFRKAHGRGVLRPRRVAKSFDSTYVRKLKTGNKGMFGMIGKESFYLFTLIKRPKFVELKKTLGFVDSWKRFEPKAWKMIHKAQTKAIRRARL